MSGRSFLKENLKKSNLAWAAKLRARRAQFYVQGE
jgi:hypothetical protein